MVQRRLLPPLARRDRHEPRHQGHHRQEVEEFGYRVRAKNRHGLHGCYGWRDEMKEEALTEKLIGIFYTVYNDLGHGFLESVYQKAFALHLARNGLAFEQQKGMHIHYLGIDLGEFFADLVVQSSVILELKAVTVLEKAHERQILNYLRASEIEV